MTTIEILPNGKAQLNVFTDFGWIHHTFSDMETLNKYCQKATQEAVERDV